MLYVNADPAQVQIANPTQQASNIQALDPNNPPPPISKAHGIVKKILVILILIFVLIGVGMASYYYNNIQKTKKRDVQRKTDLKTIANSLEEIKQKTQNQLYYPSVITESTMIKTGFLTRIPSDPKDKSPYTYSVSPIGCIINCTGYTLTACLENKNDKGKNTTSPIAPCTTRTYKIVK